MRCTASRSTPSATTRATSICLPQNVSSLVVYYNRDLFEAAGVPLPTAGWTWDDMTAAAAALRDGDQYGLGVEASIIRLAPFVWSNGGDIVDDPAAADAA